MKSLFLFSLLLLGWPTNICVARDHPIGDIETHYFKVYDSEKMDFEKIITGGGEIWVLAQVQPSQVSGRLEGVHTDPNTRKMSVIPGKSSVTVFDGFLHIDAVLSGAINKKDLPYRWELQSLITPDGSLIATDVDKTFLTFQTENYVLARLNKEAPKQGINGNPISAKPSSLYFIPAQWQQFVAPAFDYYRANSTLFQEQDARKNQVKLEALLNDANPFLVTAACRTLVRSGALDAETIQKVLLRSQTYLQAVITAVILIDAPGKPPWTTSPTSEEQIKELEDPTLPEAFLNNAASVAAVTYNSQDSSQLEGMALGIWVAATMPMADQRSHRPRYFARREKLTELLTRMQDKLNRWGIKTESDRNLNSYLRAMQIPQASTEQTPQAP